MPDVLVTGATGFIGRHLVRQLVADGKTVRCLVRKTSRLDGLPTECLDLHWGDVTDPASLRGVAQDVRVVFHLAALGHVAAVSNDAYRRFVEVNVKGTCNLVDECLKGNVEAFVHVSSTAAMGLITGEVADESTPPNPTTPYQRSKLESEQAVLRYWRERGFSTVVVRPSMVYGPDGPDSEFMKIVRLVQRGRFPIFGRGTKLTAGVYVTDLVDGLTRAADRGRAGEVYILTGGESFEFDRMLEVVAKAVGRRRAGPRLPLWFALLAAWGCEFTSKLFHITPPMTRQNVRSIVADRRFSIAKAKQELGYKPRKSLHAGIDEVLQWAAEEGLLSKSS